MNTNQEVVQKLVNLATVIVENTRAVAEQKKVQGPLTIETITNPSKERTALNRAHDELEHLVCHRMENRDDSVLVSALACAKSVNPPAMLALQHAIEVNADNFNVGYGEFVTQCLVPVIFNSFGGLKSRPNFTEINSNGELEETLKRGIWQVNGAELKIIPKFYYDWEIDQLTYSDVYSMARKSKTMFDQKLQYLNPDELLPVMDVKKKQPSHGQHVELMYIVCALYEDDELIRQLDADQYGEVLNGFPFLINGTSKKWSREMARLIQRQIGEVDESAKVIVMPLGQHRHANKYGKFHQRSISEIYETHFNSKH